MWQRVIGFVVVGIISGWVSSAPAQSVDVLLEAATTVAPQSQFLPLDTTPPGRSLAELRAAVEATSARTRAPQQVDRGVGVDCAAVDELLALHRELRRHPTLASTDRAPLLRQVNQRLAAISQNLAQRANQPAAGKRLPAAAQHVLGQQLQPFQPANTNAAAPSDPAQELIDVIQDTIAPASWDIRGGQGIIRFWGPGQAMVVRQSSDVHQQLAQLIEDLHP